VNYDPVEVDLLMLFGLIKGSVQLQMVVQITVILTQKFSLKMTGVTYVWQTTEREKNNRIKAILEWQLVTETLSNRLISFHEKF
jgi:hypothetical protein